MKIFEILQESRTSRNKERDMKSWVTPDLSPKDKLRISKLLDKWYNVEDEMNQLSKVKGNLFGNSGYRNRRQEQLENMGERIWDRIESISGIRDNTTTEGLGAEQKKVGREPKDPHVRKW